MNFYVAAASEFPPMQKMVVSVIDLIHDGPRVWFRFSLSKVVWVFDLFHRVPLDSNSKYYAFMLQHFSFRFRSSHM